jgi:hypothetical protein
MYNAGVAVVNSKVAGLVPGFLFLKGHPSARFASRVNRARCQPSEIAVIGKVI